MKKSDYDEQFAQYYIRDMELSKDVEGINHYFQLQENLMKQIINGDIEPAEKSMKELQEILQLRAKQDLPIALPRFYLSQVVLFGRELKRFGVSPAKIFSFSSACIELIYTWKSEEELMGGGIWLVKAFSEMIHERLNPLIDHPIVSQAIELINGKLEQPIEVEEVANKLTVSPSYLAKLFKQEVGMTVKQFSNHRKVIEARYYLQFSNMEIVEISDQFAFCNQSYFTKVFKEQLGLTPKQFRLSIQKSS